MRAATEAERAPCQCTRGVSRRPTYPTRRGDRCLLFWCLGCKTWQPWCAGGHPDVRCDTCTASRGVYSS